MRQTVGGAQSVVTPWATSASSTPLAAKRPWLSAKTVAPAIQGTKKLDHACLPHPGEEMFQ